MTAARETSHARKQRRAHERTELAARYGNRCGICGATPKTRGLDVDHDHRTNELRGLLCVRCNRALPSWVTADWLYAASLYMRSGSRPPEKSSWLEWLGRSSESR